MYLIQGKCGYCQNVVNREPRDKDGNPKPYLITPNVFGMEERVCSDCYKKLSERVSFFFRNLLNDELDNKYGGDK